MAYRIRTEAPITRILRPFRAFAEIEASGGIVLLIATAIALIWANSPIAESYVNTWQTKLTISVGDIGLSKALLLWINDGLMAVFFFVVGLEIKRELLVGELASLRKAALPIAAALGGMVVPALIYVAFNAGTPAVVGWGIPMATDIAFALGILALLGRRAPLALKIFLTALAIIDDIGAVLVIAVFYTAEIFWPSLGVGALFLFALAAANWLLGIRLPLVYTVLGIGLWLAFLNSGVHATIAGVLLAMTIPSWTRLDATRFLTESRETLQLYETAGDHDENPLANEHRQEVLQRLETSIDNAQTTLQRMEHALHPWVAFFIIPLFALANAGVTIDAGVASEVVHTVSVGVILGLALGKPVGITLFTWLATKSGLAELPSVLGWRHIVGAGLLGGIGFTMSLFIASLAFGATPLLPLAKIGILVGSFIAGLSGFLLLRGVAKASEDVV